MQLETLSEWHLIASRGEVLGDSGAPAIRACVGNKTVTVERLWRAGCDVALALGIGRIQEAASRNPVVLVIELS